jgi:hypothetical protein
MRDVMAPDSDAVRFENLPRERLEAMAAAGAEVLECYRVLTKVDANVVGEILKGHGTFYEWDHYPPGDVFDHETHCQYYYHAHRGENGEHGHFHTFLRHDGIPGEIRPVPYDGAEPWPTGEDQICHLGAIAMDQRGYPTHLFTTNRWVTGENWYAAEDAVALIDRFAIDHAYPSWPANRWLTAMVALFQPQMALLLQRRDAAVAAWRERHPDRDVFEDRELEVTAILPINVNRQIRRVKRALSRRAA